VGDRSFLSNSLALLLVATLIWPCAGYGSLGKPSESTSVRSEAALAHAPVGARSCEFTAIPGRHFSTPRAVLDDDPAILCDDSEDGIEGSAAVVPLSTAELAYGCIAVTAPLARLIARLAAIHARTIDFLCSYQC
jgi:hypothetical protein